LGIESGISRWDEAVVIAPNDEHRATDTVQALGELRIIRTFPSEAG
jgi:hypothetical protein